MCLCDKVADNDLQYIYSNHFAMKFHVFIAGDFKEGS